MLDSLMTGADEPCPKCGSREIQLAKSGEYPRRFGGNLKAYRKCATCGHVFEPASRLSYAAGVLLFGVVMLACGVAGVLVPSLSLFDRIGAGSVLRCLLSLLIIYGALSLMAPGARALRSAWKARKGDCNGTDEV
jgi:uncharacterized protein (DUF983 family)